MSSAAVPYMHIFPVTVIPKPVQEVNKSYCTSELHGL